MKLWAICPKARNVAKAMEAGSVLQWVHTHTHTHTLYNLGPIVSTVSQFLELLYSLTYKSVLDLLCEIINTAVDRKRVLVFA